MEKIKDFIEKTINRISEKTRLSKKLLLSVLLLAAGIVALLLSEMPKLTKTSAADVTTVTAKSSEEEYAAELEERLTLLISRIEGVGEATVMITLESSVEDVYLHNFDYGENVDSSGKNSVERKDEYVIIDGSSGEQGIVVRRAEPKVRGVAVVCEGGGSEQVRVQIVDAVTALLDISSARVSVAKMN